MPVGPAAEPRRSRSCNEARRGGWLGSIPYAGVVDDSEVDRDRPIKCCDAIHSIFHYPPAPAMRGEAAWRGGLRIREILTVGGDANDRPDVGDATHPIAATRVARAGRDTSGYADRGWSIRAWPRSTPPRSRTIVRLEPADVSNGICVMAFADLAPAHSGAAGFVVGKRGNTARREIAGPSVGRMAAADEAGKGRRSGRRWRPGRPPGRFSRRGPTPSARRCAGRAPCRASGDQSQSRW